MTVELVLEWQSVGELTGIGTTTTAAAVRGGFDGRGHGVGVQSVAEGRSHLSHVPAGGVALPVQLLGDNLVRDTAIVTTTTTIGAAAAATTVTTTAAVAASDARLGCALSYWFVNIVSALLRSVRGGIEAVGAATAGSERRKGSF